MRGLVSIYNIILMAEHNEIGKIGERIALEYLEKHGYAILDTNWRYGHHEVDIVAYLEGVIVFVEVKTRTSTIFGNPEDAVDTSKQRIYIRMANKYVIQHQRFEEVRFDIISIVFHNLSDVKLIHLRNAFNTIN